MMRPVQRARNAVAFFPPAPAAFDDGKVMHGNGTIGQPIHVLARP
jgi:hypothetical protein